MIELPPCKGLTVGEALELCREAKDILALADQSGRLLTDDESRRIGWIYEQFMEIEEALHG